MSGSCIVTQLCPVIIYLLFNCAPWNPICDQQVALDVSQPWLEWRVDWFASGLALMFCYCYLHNAVQPSTAGLLLFLFSNMPAFLQSYIDFFMITLFLPKAQFSIFPPFNFKTTEFSPTSILTACFKHRWICVNPWLHFILSFLLATLMISDVSLRRVIRADAGKKKKTDKTLMELQNA